MIQGRRFAKFEEMWLRILQQAAWAVQHTSEWNREGMESAQHSHLSSSRSRPFSRTATYTRTDQQFSRKSVWTDREDSHTLS